MKFTLSNLVLAALAVTTAAALPSQASRAQGASLQARYDNDDGHVPDVDPSDQDDYNGGQDDEPPEIDPKDQADFDGGENGDPPDVDPEDKDDDSE